ncbi:hypothetical protein AGABI1DRAFT_134112 [Agaricus bisporus var. burnettii JB137-S8]|uniref:Uncharacterized protein n=1 Tax=Agaricus bisporus var. burnettii (strain JB137-S8 / ATCC MYA-4627 / FGSC 10392) TaxID=597362 RepID=K5WEU0_AGABU|nr:uncharacterized protein AGABI1DRAFT_134112 [Agaricus bisporus var. burnettii JB137-S8]EKM73776.1 hypothetical protein AGABI1DRAFT_134112 [Agaricus bisporus var. burnettii JB137-S8]
MVELPCGRFRGLSFLQSVHSLSLGLLIRKPPGQWWKLKQPDLAGNDSDSDDEAALLADSEFCEVEFAGAVSGADPRSYRLAMKSPDSDCWTEAFYFKTT